MDGCAPYQALMLDYLYDLPESNERQALQQHLEQCVICPDLMIRARSQQKLLAAAAKAQFCGVQFTVPAESRLVLNLSARRIVPHWLPWAAAACLVLAL